MCICGGISIYLLGFVGIISSLDHDIILLYNFIIIKLLFLFVFKSREDHCRSCFVFLFYSLILISLAKSEMSRSRWVAIDSSQKMHYTVKSNSEK